MKRKLLISVLSLWGLLLLSILPTYATSLETMPDSYTDMENHIPDEVAELLPEGLFSSDPEEALTAAETLTRPEYLFRVVLEAVGLRMDEALSLLVTLLGLLLLSALLHRLRESISGSSGDGVGFVLRLSMYALIVMRAAAMLSWVKTYFDRLSTLMTGLIPVMGVLYALGGNVTSAAAHEEILLIFLNICEYVAVTVTPAMCGICLAFALLDAFGGGLQVRFAPLAGMVKGWYTFLLGFIMFLISVALSAQSVLASAADSLSMKGIRYAVSQMIPVVGGAISGTMGTVAAGVDLLRSVSGICGILLVGLMLLPSLVQLLLFRACYRMSSSVASILGCDGEAKLLGEMGSLYGYMAAAVSICAVVCVLALALFAHSTAAVGGS